MVKSIILSVSYLPKGDGRLSGMRLISALSEHSELGSALYEGRVIDVLVVLSSECDEMVNKKNKPDSVVPNLNDLPGFLNVFNSVAPKASKIERTTSGASTISVASSNNSHSKGRR
jgi:hypothetical protein